MSSSNLDSGPTDPQHQDRLGRRHQLRVDITIALSLVPTWLKRALLDRNDEKARSARTDIVERIATSIERRFRITWLGTDDYSDDALPIETSGPLFGGPEIPVSDPASQGCRHDVGIVGEPQVSSKPPDQETVTTRRCPA